MTTAQSLVGTLGDRGSAHPVRRPRGRTASPTGSDAGHLAYRSATHDVMIVRETTHLCRRQNRGSYSDADASRAGFGIALLYRLRASVAGEKMAEKVGSPMRRRAAGTAGVVLKVDGTRSCPINLPSDEDVVPLEHIEQCRISIRGADQRPSVRNGIPRTSPRSPLTTAREGV